MATQKWVADPNHSEIQFKVKHLMITTVTGSFKKFDVTAETEDEDFTKGKFMFTADVSSISTGTDDRDTHLKSPDFFDAATYPQIRFESTSVEGKPGDEELAVLGDFTIRDVTKNIRLKVDFGGVIKDPYGNTKAGFTINGKVSRKEFGLTWNAVTEAGGVVVSDDVRLACEVQLIKQA